MTAVRSVDSLKYGARLFGYLLGVVVVGGGGVTAGVYLAYPEYLVYAAGGDWSGAVLGGGAVLGFVGAAVLVTGLFGLAHKLVADSVAAGVVAGSPESGEQSEAGATGRTAERDDGAEAADSDRDGDGESGGTDPGPETDGPGEEESEEADPIPEEGSAGPGDGEPVPEATVAGGTDGSAVGGAGDQSDEVETAETRIVQSDATESDDSKAGWVSPAADADSARSDGDSGSPNTTSETLESEWESKSPDPSGSGQAGASDTDSTGEADAARDAYDEDGVTSPPEPSPGEIAFGTSGDDEDAGESVEPAGSSSSDDPLADLTDET